MFAAAPWLGGMMEIARIKEVFLNKNENIVLFTLVFFAILFPIVLPHQQLVLGSIINAILFLSALYLKDVKAYVPAFLPSLVVAGFSILFSKPTILPLLPIIWIGNCTLIFITKSKNNMFLAAFVKPIVMGIGTLFLILIGVVKAKMLIPFFALQFVTAFIGAIIIIIARFLYRTCVA